MDGQKMTATTKAGDRSARTGQLGQKSLNETAATRELGQGSRDRKKRTGWPGHDRMERTVVSTGQ
jgi:hypothetical protein